MHGINKQQWKQPNKFHVACVYRSPSGNVHEFVNKFQTFVHDITFKNITRYICGDFNIDLQKAFLILVRV